MLADYGRHDTTVSRQLGLSGPFITDQVELHTETCVTVE